MSNTYKVVIVGDSGSGKTSLLNQYVSGTFNNLVPTTIGVEFSHKSIDRETKLTFWDTAGQERFQSLMSSFYRGAHAVMFVYDTSSVASFNSLNQWWREYKSYGDITKSVAILVGNKIDLQREVPIETARRWAVDHNICYEEVSAKTSDNITNAFDTLIHQLHRLPEVHKETIEMNAAPKSDRCCY
jgi:small GTP-binding protein